MGKVVEPTYEALVEFLSERCNYMLPEICAIANDCSKSLLSDGDATPREAVVEDLLSRWMGNSVDCCDWCGEYEHNECMIEVEHDTETGTRVTICPTCSAGRHKTVCPACHGKRYGCEHSDTNPPCDL